MLVLSPLIYAVSVVIPLVLTLEVLNMVCLTTNNCDKKSNNSSRKSSSLPTISTTDVKVRTLVYMMKYWSLYVIAFGIFSNLTWSLLSVLPLGSLAFLVLNGMITLELIYQYIEFIESQDGKVLFLFNKLNDSKVTWWQWMNYATTYDESNIASHFVFGKLTQFIISLVDKSPFPKTDYLDRGFDIMELYLKQFIHHIIMQRKTYVQQQSKQQDNSTGAEHKRSTPAFSASMSKFAEGYDMLDDLIDESRQRKI